MNRFLFNWKLRILKKLNRATLMKVYVAFFLVFGTTFFGYQAESATHGNSHKKKNQLSTTVPKSIALDEAQVEGGHMETYKDLIAKAQNLTLQRDRLQTSQILVRAIEQESNHASEREELIRALDELSTIFYTEKSQMLYATAESLFETKPKDAIDKLVESLRNEEGNLSILVSLARGLIMSQECNRAETYIQQAEKLNPYYGQVKLLRLQVLDCQNKMEELSTSLKISDPFLETFAEPLRTLRMKDLWRQEDIKQMKNVVGSWELSSPDYPEVYFWKWRLSQKQKVNDRASALKYSQLCQTLTPRKRKKYALDVDLCRGKDQIDAYLKTSGFQDEAPTEEEENE